MKILTAEHMRECDRMAIEDLGIPGIVLMENAALQVVEVLRQKFPLIEEAKVGIIAGKGNNGGDGFAVARHLTNMGADVRIYLIAEKKKISGDAKTNLEIADKMGIPIYEIRSEEDFNRIKIKLRHEQIFIDAILGTGTSKAVAGLFAHIIGFINKTNGSKISVDIPSGLSADTGALIGIHVKADMTIALANPKVCHFFYPAVESCGEIVIADIGIPSYISDAHPGINVIGVDDVKCVLPKRRGDTHKGTYGHLLAICGSIGKGGAAALSALSALRTGAGLVTLALPDSLNGSFETGIPEVMSIPLPETKEGSISDKAYEKLKGSITEKRCCMIGPGLTTNKETAALVRRIIEEFDIPMLIDADAINNLAGHLELLKKRKAPTVLTPHPGEMGRLWSVSSKDIQADRLGYAIKTAVEYYTYVVLKGAGTIIATPDGSIYINTTGNPGMATGGTGDVLSGMISGFLAQGFGPLQSCIKGVYLHGLAGELAASAVGEYSLTASDLISSIPDAIIKVSA